LWKSSFPFSTTSFFLTSKMRPGAFGFSITAIIALINLKKYQPEHGPARLLRPPPPSDWSDKQALNKSGMKEGVKRAHPPVPAKVCTRQSLLTSISDWNRSLDRRGGSESYFLNAEPTE
jgi:hypothetical protein